MSDLPYRSALIVGAGAGISASLARRLSALGVKVGLAARNIDKLQPLLSQTNAIAFTADARDPGAVPRAAENACGRTSVRPIGVMLRPFQFSAC